MNKKNFICILFMFFITDIMAQETKNQKEILLIGTFHFDNPGKDLAKTGKFNILSAQSQKELENIAEQIKKFGPSKLFVEWDDDDQFQLDTLYNLYVNNKYADYIEKKYPKNTYYKENEVFQLGFRLAKKSSIKRVFGIDIPMDLPFDSLMNVIDKTGQNDLKNKIYERTKLFEKIENENRKNLSLTALILLKNEPKTRALDLGSYVTLFNQAGGKGNFVGALLVSEWYKRNLYMYALVQKLTEASDKKLVVILGASHIALFKHFIDLDENYKVVELKTLLNK